MSVCLLYNFLPSCYVHGRGLELLNRKTGLVLIILIGILILSVALNLHYYVNIARANENVFNTMRSQALVVYSGEISAVAYFLGKYVETSDYELIDKEVAWGVQRAIWLSELCVKGLTRDVGLLYYELFDTAWVLDICIVDATSPLNMTMIEAIIPLLTTIAHSFFGFDIETNQDPLERLSQSEFDEVINACRQVQEITYGAPVDFL